MAYVREPFEDLDVMNAFMFNKLTTEQEVAEKCCRRMIKSLLGKDLDKIQITAESFHFPDDPNSRGVRLDVQIDELKDDVKINVYDIEPHRDKEPAYPKKNRYVQAMIDKNTLASGDNDFSKLPNLTIICITNFDPFGFDRMVYRINHHCADEPALVYNDGVEIYYFNTEGTRGGSDQLKNFLKYIENSKLENVVDEATSEMNEYVRTIKSNKDIGGIYMTLQNLMDNYAKEYANDAFEQGRLQTIMEFVSDGSCTLDNGAEKLNITVEELTDKMKEAGYKIP